MAQSPAQPHDRIETGDGSPSSESLRAALRAGVVLVFQRVVAMDVLDATGAALDPATTISSSTPIGGEVTGRLTLFLPISTGERIYVAMTGRREAARAAMMDLAGELANMIAGSTLAALGCADAWIGCPGGGAPAATPPRSGEGVALRLSGACGPFRVELRLAIETPVARIATRRVRARDAAPLVEAAA